MASGLGIGCVANVLSKVFCNLWNKVVEKGKMIIYLPQAFIQMKKEVGALDNEIHEINAELDRKQWPAKKRVQTWLDEAGKLKESFESIDTEYETYQEHKNCLGCCPNCLCRYRISKHIRDWKRNVSELKSERAQPDFPRSGEYGDPTPRQQIPIQDHDSGLVVDTKLSENTKRLESWLTDEDSNIRRIGIIGMGGVGKTSLLNIINDSQKVKTSFQLIIKVIVSRNNTLELQKQVAERLNIPEFPEYFEARKDVLRNFLENKKILLLLDDMWADDLWTKYKLQDLGVSLNDTGSKIVLTTRDEEVCARMNVQERITVKQLLEEDGWQLFRSRAFENQNGNVPKELEEVARKIAKECKGLPLAIIVVAAAMTHHTDLSQWEVALHQMQNVHETFDDLHPVMDRELFQRLKWSYDVLNRNLKACFLYLAAYPEDREIYCQEIIDIWIAEGVVEGGEESYLFDTGYSFVTFLKDRCLIEVVDTAPTGRISSVKIHDILRDLAIRIAEKEHGCYFKAGQGVSHFPLEKVDSKRYAQISLMSNNIQSLPRTFTCSSLSVLLLSENPGIKEVPESFLNELPSLRVLDLSNTGITCLPPSIGNLKHLVSLQLKVTGICELPENICDLKELQFLNLSFCRQLWCLPESISALKRLRALDIGGCEKLRHLPRGISELVSLESLNMECSNISLSFEEDANAERKSACLKELQSLRSLRVLEVQMQSPVKEGVVRNWSKMRELGLKFDDDASQDELPQDMQAMKDLESFWLIGYDVERLPSCLTQFRKLAFLEICLCKKLKEVPAELPCLRELRIWSCDKLEELELGMGFPKLESLHLSWLDSLKCVGPAASGSGSGGLGEGASPLPMLKEVRVVGCDQLKRLRGGWDKLKCLESIKCRPRELWDAIECDDPTIKTSLQSKWKLR